MKNFGIGLSLGLIGAMIWILGVGLVACGEWMDEYEEHSRESSDYYGPIIPGSYEGTALWQFHAVRYGGFGLMVAGPVVYWITLPIIELVKRRRQGE